jgi:hypothetical protein
MLAQPFTKKTLLVVLILAAALITLAFAVYSAPAASVSADRSYDAIEQMRIAAPQGSSYDVVEAVRVNRNTLAQSYNQIEQVRMDRHWTFDTSYNAVEDLRVSRTQANHSYDAIENLRLLRTLK